MAPAGEYDLELTADEEMLGDALDEATRLAGAEHPCSAEGHRSVVRLTKALSAIMRQVKHQLQALPGEVAERMRAEVAVLIQAEIERLGGHKAASGRQEGGGSSWASALAVCAKASPVALAVCAVCAPVTLAIWVWGKARGWL
jgi:hypothetical protein